MLLNDYKEHDATHDLAGGEEELHRVHHPDRDQPEAQAGAAQVAAPQRPHDLPPGTHEGLQARGRWLLFSPLLNGSAICAEN